LLQANGCGKATICMVKAISNYRFYKSMIITWMMGI
jgi:hypothetical protein